MKRLLLSIWIISCLLQVKVYAQKNANAAASAESKAKIEEILVLVEKKKNSPSELDQAIHDLSAYLYKCNHTDIIIPDEIKEDMTKRLVEIFNQIDDAGINRANKVRIIEVIARFDNSHTAHAFVLKMFESKNKRHQKMALWAMGPGGVQGDDIYDRIKTLMDTGIIEKEKFLYALRSANRNRALKEIQDFLAKTKSQDQFVRKGLLLCGYNDPELLDVLIDRYDEFKNIGPKTEEERSTYAPAATAFDPKVLRQYMEIRDGKRFRTALEVMGAKGISGNKDFALYEKKLKSKNMETREAVLDFFDHRMGEHFVSQEKIRVLLKEAGVRESDVKLKDRIRQMEKKYGEK